MSLIYQNGGASIIFVQVKFAITFREAAAQWTVDTNWLMTLKSLTRLNLELQLLDVVRAAT